MATGTFSFTVRVTDALSATADRPYTLRVFEPGNLPRLTNITLCSSRRHESHRRNPRLPGAGTIRRRLRTRARGGFGRWDPLPSLDSATRGLGAVCIGGRLYAIGVNRSGRS
jgi:hypothetical protein